MSNKLSREEVRQQIIAAIVEAFQDVRRDGGITIHEADVIDSYGFHGTREAARQKDTEIHWQEVPSEKLEKLSEVFPFLDSKGFHFYIPAYMKWSLENLHSRTSDSVYGTVGSLQANRKKQFALFNAAQSAAIFDFLSFMAKYEDCEDAKRAIARYWDKSRREARKP